MNSKQVRINKTDNNNPDCEIRNQSMFHIEWNEESFSIFQKVVDGHSILLTIYQYKCKPKTLLNVIEVL